jgi:hypothetical protein
MAVIFISPKQRQDTFFMLITVIFLLILIGVSLVAFLSKPKESSIVLVFNKPKVNVNMDIFESSVFKGLVPFSEMQIQYAYSAIDKDKKPKTGSVSATSVEEATKILESQGLTVVDIKEVTIGRDNPFIPYYKITPPTPRR